MAEKSATMNLFVLIVAKCIVNIIDGDIKLDKDMVLIVAKCIVNTDGLREISRMTLY